VANGTTTPVITLQVPTASAANRGALSAADWTTFNNKGSGSVTSVAQSFTGGLISVAGSPITTSGTLALTVAGTSGGIPYFSSASTWATSAALAASALVVGGGAGAAPATTTTGTGVVTALGVNTGTAGAFVVNGGALGTPSSGTVTNLTGTASININGTVGATTATTGKFTTVQAATTMGVGGTTPSASGAGISFPATQSASSDANTLDDYEEGTATITLTCTSGTITMLGGFNVIRYTKIGRLVAICGRFYVNTVSSPATSLTLNGLPFTCANAAAAESSFSVFASGLTATAITAIQAFVAANATTISIQTFAAGASSNNLADNVQSGTQFWISGTYTI
jgi:hypothetical protein